MGCKIITDSNTEQEISATDGFVRGYKNSKAQKISHQLPCLRPKQTALSGFLENNKIKQKKSLINAIALEKNSIFNRKINIRLVLCDDNYQHVRGFL